MRRIPCRIVPGFLDYQISDLAQASLPAYQIDQDNSYVLCLIIVLLSYDEVLQSCDRRV